MRFIAQGGVVGALITGGVMGMSGMNGYVGMLLAGLWFIVWTVADLRGRP